MKALNSQTGSVAVIILLMYSAVVISLSGLILKGSNNKPNIDAEKLNIEMIKNNIITLIKSDQAWNNTVQDITNSGINCLNEMSTCDSVTSETEFNLRDSTGDIYIHSGTGGFAENGNPCDENSTSESCPIKYRLTWTRLCQPTGTCSNPRIQVTGTLQYHPTSHNDTSINEKHYKFVVIR